MIKKILFAVCAMLILCLTFCTKHKTTEPADAVSVETELNFDSIVVKDYQTVKSLTKDSVSFYEAQIVFNRLLTSDTTPVPVRVMTVMQTPDTVWTVSHAINEAPVLNKEFGFWLEDRPINLERTQVSLDSAIVLLNKANVKNPASNLCVFRKPLYKVVYPDAFYIFGSMNTSFVNVDCHTGKVTPASAQASVSNKSLAK